MSDPRVFWKTMHFIAKISKAMAFPVLILVTIFAWIYVINCSNGNGTSIETKEIPAYKIDHVSEEDDLFEEENNIWEPPVKEEPVKEQSPMRIVNYQYTIKKIFVKDLYATCYSKLDSPIEAKGIYANQNFADRLNLSERRIRRHHYTVALNPQMKEYHTTLIELPGNIWTHKYRVHVPDYNKPVRPDAQEIMKNKGCLDLGHRLLQVFNNPYFSVPRDRMKQKGRIDCLFTTAGNYNSIKQRQRQWAKKNTHNWSCEFWEIERWAIYNDGTKEKVE